MKALSVTPREQLERNSIDIYKLVDASGDGKISYTEFLFAVTLLSIPASEFVYAFRMVDVDGDESLSIEEFQQVISQMMRQKNQEQVQGEWMDRIFGPQRKRKISGQDFSEFVKRIQRQFLEIEYLSSIDDENLNKNSSQNISPIGISEALKMLTRNCENKEILIERIEHFPNKLKEVNVSLDQWIEMDNLSREYKRVKKVFALFCPEPENLSKEQFFRVIRAAAGISFAPEWIDVFAELFPAAGKHGNVNGVEFVKLLQTRREKFGIKSSRSDNLLLDNKTFSCLIRCAKGES